MAGPPGSGKTLLASQMCFFRPEAVGEPLPDAAGILTGQARPLQRLLDRPPRLLRRKRGRRS